MRELGLLLLLLLTACSFSDDTTDIDEAPQAEADLATVTPECLFDPCANEPPPELPFVLGEVVVTSKVDGLSITLPAITKSLEFEVVGKRTADKGEQIIVRVTLTACPHDDSFALLTEASGVPNSQTHTITFKKEQPRPPVDPRTIDVAANDVERISGVDAGFFDGLPVTGVAPLLLVAARDAVIFLNLETDDEVERLTTPSGATYGAAPFSNASGKAVVATGDWGAAVWQYVAGSFALLGGAPFVTGNITDVAVCPDGRLVVANNTAGEIQFYDLVGAKYEIDSGLTIALEGVVSVSKLPNGEYLANTESPTGNGTAWFIPDNAVPVVIGPLAKGPRLITTSPAGDFAVMPCLGDGISFPQVFFLSSTSGEWKIPQAVAAIRAVSCGIEERADGNLWVAIPSSRTDEVRYLAMQPDATILDEINEALSAGCKVPSHAVIVDGATYLSCIDGSTIDCRPVPE